MSRRKQGRPQQRLTLDSVESPANDCLVCGHCYKKFPLPDISKFVKHNYVEQENDLLVCGDCQSKFPLQDITKFIKHKVNKCNKENECIEPGDRFEDQDDGSDKEGVSAGCIGAKRTSISAPISRKESFDGSLKTSPRPSLESTGSVADVRVKVNGSPLDPDDTDVEMKESKPERLPLQSKQVVDAYSNTTHTEPLKFICDTCKKQYSSAWALLQHAQREHGMRIYVTNKESSSPKPPQHHHSHPQPKPRAPLSLKQEDSPRAPSEPLRTTPSVGSTSSGEGPHSSHQSPNNPFMFPRIPSYERHPLSPLPALNPFPHRNPADFRLEFPGEHFHHRTNIPGMMGLSPFDPGPSPFNFERARPPPGNLHASGLTGNLDFYSKRLRDLAARDLATSTASPVTVRKPITPPFSQSPTSSLPNTLFTSITPPASLPSEIDKSHGTGSLTPPAKLKACEFCGKSFRFQSNLIVHRRSHTGEKPFKCPLCPHACTQQSKLKRHMKTHANKNPLGSSVSNASEGSLASSRSSPDSSKMGGEEEEEEEENEEEEELEEEEDMEEEIEGLEDLRDGIPRIREHPAISELREKQGEGIPSIIDHNGIPGFRSSREEIPGLRYPNGIPSLMDIRDKNEDKLKAQVPMSAQSVTPAVSTATSELAARLFDRRIEQTITKELSKDQDNAATSSAGDKSLLSEMMEHTGLKNIQAYNEAFKQAQQALSSNVKHESDDSSSQKSSENSQEEEIKKEKDGDEIKVKSDPDLEESPDLKKDEPRESKENSLPVTPITPHMNSIENAYLPAFWFPRPSHELFPHHFPLPRYQLDSDLTHNGFNPSSNPESALKNITPPKQGPLNHPMATNGPPAAKRESRRADTCEYCGKIFKNCSNLTVHRRSHTGEKPYQCKLCSYACAQSSKLTRHMKTHGRSGKDIYRCKFCDMPFSVPSTLEKHMRKCVDNRQVSAMMSETTAALMCEQDTDTNSTTVSGLNLPPTPSIYSDTNQPTGMSMSLAPSIYSDTNSTTSTSNA